MAVRPGRGFSSSRRGPMRTTAGTPCRTHQRRRPGASLPMRTKNRLVPPRQRGYLSARSTFYRSEPAHHEHRSARPEPTTSDRAATSALQPPADTCSRTPCARPRHLPVIHRSVAATVPPYDFCSIMDPRAQPEAPENLLLLGRPKPAAEKQYASLRTPLAELLQLRG